MESSAQPDAGEGRLLSVGHSNHDWDTFVKLLRDAAVTAVADVRSRPFSRRLPQFNRPELEAGLRREGIAYVFLGDLLGGRPDDPDLYDPLEDGRVHVVNYERVRATSAFRRGLERLLHGTERYTIAMLCGEEDPLDCHRGLMIAPALRECGVAPRHLRRGGRVETAEDMEERLLRETKMAEQQGGLFPVERGELLAEAYRAMNRVKAFRVAAGPEREWSE